MWLFIVVIQVLVSRLYYAQRKLFQLFAEQLLFWQMVLGEKICMDYNSVSMATDMVCKPLTSDICTVNRLFECIIH